MLRIFNYNGDTGEYNGEGEADESPLEPGKYLLPAYSTIKEPPSLEDHKGMMVCFDRENDEWVFKKIPAKPLPTIEEEFPKIPHMNLTGYKLLGDLGDSTNVYE